MDRATVSRIEGWDARTVTGGHAGLADLAAAEFTGAIESAGTYLFVLNGRIVGVVGGTIDDFEGADSTAYAAPDPSLPLLFAMRERGGDVKGEYYTDETPIQEVDETLSEAGFTGYLELSENVLSGDYYVVYYGGRSLSAAFVGTRDRVVTGEEAFELAADEVGIYEVRSVDLEVTDLPEPADEASAGGASAEDASAGAAAAGGSTEDPTDLVADAEEPAEDEPGVDAGPSTDEERADRERPTDDDEEPVEAEAAPTDDGRDRADADGVGGDAGREPADAGREPADADTDVDRASPDPESDGWAGVGTEAAEDAPAEESDPSPTDVDAATATGADPADDDAPAGETDWSATGDTAVAGDDAEILTDDPPEEPTAAPETGASSDGPRGEEPTDRDAAASRGEPSAVEGPAEEAETDERFRDEARWREARTVPALDPEETALPADPTVSDAPAAEPDADEAHDEEPLEAEPADGEVEALRDRVQELEEALEATEQDRRRQAERVEELAEERDELRSERAALQERIDELEARIESQEAQIEEQAAAAGPPKGDRQDTGAEAVDPASALDRTDVFVRYGSQGKATLETAHAGQAGHDEVAENLRLETHNRFDADDVTVEGRPFESYLADTIEYRFVSWLVEELLYELQETGNERALGGVYDALPAIDRAEFDGAVTVDDGEGNEERETFDVVCRDRMGKPLLVANINDSLDPATGEMMAGLVEDATAVAEAHESIGAAFVVTASFFEPAALETAAEATGGGFLSRDSKKSFVKLSRKGGYHLCLVEARAGDFHVAVPEL